MNSILEGRIQTIKLWRLGLCPPPCILLFVINNKALGDAKPLTYLKGRFFKKNNKPLILNKNPKSQNINPKKTLNRNPNPIPNMNPNTNPTPKS